MPSRSKFLLVLLIHGSGCASQSQRLERDCSSLAIPGKPEVQVQRPASHGRSESEPSADSVPATEGGNGRSDLSFEPAPKVEMSVAQRVRAGSLLLYRALQELGYDSLRARGAERHLAAAEACFGSALQRSPNSYEALLGSGVVQLVRYRFERSVNRAALARGSLQRAYAVRQGAYEPLYYLAELRFLEGDLDAAEALLGFLEAAGLKLGATYVLSAEIAARRGDFAQAEVLRQKALASGQSTSSIEFAAHMHVSSRGGR